jgi:hypothetical protein
MAARNRSGIGAGLNRLTFRLSVVHFDQHRLGEAEPERQLDHHHAALRIRRLADEDREHQLPRLALKELLDGATIERLAVTRAFDPPGRGLFGRLGIAARRDQDPDRGRGHQLCDVHEDPRFSRPVRHRPAAPLVTTNFSRPVAFTLEPL